MKSIRFSCSIVTIACLAPLALLCAQTTAKVAFEVASIKAAPPLLTLVQEIQSGKRGIGSLQQNVNDARADFGYMPLNNLIMYAYKLKAHQIIGPDWMTSEAFEIHAKLPEGASKDQVPEMMQSLLAERFKFVAHRENNEQPIYALIVSKDGLKMKEAVEEVAASAENPAEASPGQGNAAKGEVLSLKTVEGPVSIKQEGRGMVLNSGKTGQLRMNMGTNGAMSLEATKLAMPDFAELLTQFLDRPVVDMTGLKGSYQVALEIPMADLLRMAQQIAPRLGVSLPPGLGGAGSIVGATPGSEGLGASDPAGGGIFQAVEKLGLKLDSRKAPVETLIVDSIERTPTED